MALMRLRIPVPSFEDSADKMVSRVNFDTVAIKLQIITHDIHAGCLFMTAGESTIQILCDKLGAPKEGRIYSHWTELADHLGNSDAGEPRVTRDQQMNIDNHLKTRDGPVWMVLATFAQWDDARLSSVISAIKKIERMDIIGRIRDHVYRLVEYARNNAKQDSTSGIFKPTSVPWVPLILRPPCSEISKHFKIVNITSTPSIPRPDDRGLISNTGPNTTYAAIIMLTFANDGEEAAYRIAKIFRSHVPRIGVLILNEQLDHVFVGGTEFINDCFEQVDKIVPILTRGYLDTINGHPNRVQEPESPFAKDQEYAKYIYKSFTNELTGDRCQNHRIRCIVPSETATIPKRLNLALNVWFRETDIQEFIRYLLAEKSKSRRT